MIILSLDLSLSSTGYSIINKDYNLIKVSYERLVDEMFSYHTTDFKDYIVPLEDINVENNHKIVYNIFTKF